MTRTHTISHSRHWAQAFTLIEVLIATFVIALGSIGLIALFAGAASQQRVASQTTMSVIVSKNAEAIISPRFGRIAGTLFDGQNNPADLDRGVWYPVPSDSEGNLSINPDATGADDRERAYFLLERNEATVLFDLPDHTNWRNQALGAGHFIRGQVSNLYNTSPYAIRPFPVSRLDARETGSIQVITNDKPNPGPDYDQRGEVTTRFVYVNANYDNIPTGAWPPNAPFDSDGEYALFTPHGGYPGTQWPYILVKRQESSRNEPLAYIERFDLTALVRPNGGADTDAYRHVQRIVIPRVVHRSSDVISSGDRVIEARDPDYSEGVRPDVGYSLLYRKLESGASQIAVFTYFISGTNRAGRFSLAEPAGSQMPGPFGDDSGSEEWGLRMLDDVTLAYDDDREQFYFEASSDEQISALAPGAVLLVSGEKEGSGPDRVAGADLPVRVVRQIRAPGGGNFRSYIDRVPRARGKSMLPFRNQTRDLDLWTIRETVVAEDGSRWSLRPRELRIFNVN